MIRNAYDDMKAALARRIPSGAVPIWELEFHAWDAALGRHVVLGEENPPRAFVLGASNAMQKDVLRPNYRAMIEAWKSVGQYTGS